MNPWSPLARFAAIGLPTCIFIALVLSDNGMHNLAARCLVSAIVLSAIALALNTNPGR
jgi:hypothetical protein